ncbi:FAD-binding oxidoreductase [Streptomyces griseorubiginosus]|uniref:FAD-binding oxidoreductase n=1 Tax=Streptomyces griseorubiginosus TaxID=67304 RepID=UPI0036494F17
MSQTSVQPGNVELALRDFVAELGSEAVLTDAEALAEFRDPFWVRGSADFDASAMVMPRNVEEVQAVVRIANEYQIPLWVFGQGRNNAYGGAAPRLPGSVLVNLRNMNRVLEVNEELAYAVVEPGVRFFDLYDALEECGGMLWASVPDLGWGSVVGNALECGIGAMPLGDHASNICSMEVVLPTGEIMRTGMGALTNSKVTHAYRHSFGPEVEGLFFQSSLGIVTSMGIRLMPRPERVLCGLIGFEGEQLVEPVIDIMRGLMLEGIVQGLPLLGQGIGMEDDSKGVMDPSSGTWNVRFALYGREERVEADYRIVENAFSEVPGVRFSRYAFRGDDRASQDGNHDDRARCGIPDMDFWNMFKEFAYGEDTAHLDLSPVGPMVGRDVAETVELIRSLYASSPLPYAWGVILQGRCVTYVTATVFNPTEEQQTREVYRAYNERVVQLAKAGYPVYRTNIHHMDHVAEQYDFNDHIYRRFNETLKDALDPKGILQPGKRGIWPARLRESSRRVSPRF